ncbi:MAG: hypothetical protein H6728_13685 [Myxococcales bacterium]|nr:hypothetical protein [Myxococcales bacterium]MCB9644122.1 hypothetical protein [Myxococcales bacterium]
MREKLQAKISDRPADTKKATSSLAKRPSGEAEPKVSNGDVSLFGRWVIVICSAGAMFGLMALFWVGMERVRQADQMDKALGLPMKLKSASLSLKEESPFPKVLFSRPKRTSSFLYKRPKKPRIRRDKLPDLEIPAFRSSYIQAELDQLRTIFSQTAGHQERAILAGLHWMARYVEVEKRFISVFSDYVLALHELTLFGKHRPWVEIVRSVIRRSFARAWRSRERIFSRDAAGKWDFISLIYLLYQHDIPRDPYVGFYHQFFVKGDITKGKSFEKALQQRDYDRLGDFIIDSSFLDLFLRKYKSSPFRLPKNRLAYYVRALEKLPLLHTSANADGYHDQNYFVTHVILSLNHYSETPLPDTPLLRRMLRYLKRELWTVRHKVDDIDLLAEFIYSFKCYGAEGLPAVKEATRYLLFQQDPRGAWGKEEDWKGDAYEAIHPTLAAITALNYHKK